MKPIIREAILERRQPHFRWGAVFAGTVLAVGVWILLQVLGMGLGLSAIDVDDAGSLKDVGIGTGIWTLIAPLIATFVGAFLVGRLCGARDRKVGGMHGSVMWALSIAIGLWAMLGVVTSLASGVARVGGAAASVSKSVVSGAATAAGGVDIDKAMSALGINADELLAPINRRLEGQGKPPLTAEQLKATLRGVANRSLKEGRVDREVVIDELARNTALTRTDARDIADQLGDQFENASTKLGGAMRDVGQRAEHVALEAADRTGKVLLFGGLMMLLSLASAIAGGALGVPRWHERRESTIVTPETAPPATVIPPPHPPIG